MTRSPAIATMPLRELLWPALRGDLIRALAGLYWIATRRRVRGWSRLHSAASLYPHNYSRWVARCEGRAFSEFRRVFPVPKTTRVVALVITDGCAERDAAARSEESIRAAFGTDTPIYMVDGRGGQISSLTEPHEGAWVLPLLAGDVVSPELGDVLARRRGSSQDPGLIYWDEDRLVNDARCEPWIKPDWDELLFRQVGGLLGASAMPLVKLRQAVGDVANMSLDRDALERLAMDMGRRFGSAHVPLVMTHRSIHRPAGFESSSSGRVRQVDPSVSVLVPTRDRADLLGPCIQGVRNTPYAGQLELLVIDNGSSDPRTLRLLDDIRTQERTTVIRDSGPFNFSRLNNRAAAAAEGEFLCFLNNDVEPISSDWLSLMVRHAAEQGVGAVGALLLYPNGRIQHAGVAIGLGGAAGHVQKGVDPADRRFWTWHGVSREVSAVTAAAMVVRRSTFLELGGFDEEAFPVAFNDVDLCLRLKRAGLRNLYVADARLLHRESESRGDDRAPRRARAFAAELKQLQQRWHTEDFVDPHFSPLFSRASERCILAL